MNYGKITIGMKLQHKETGEVFKVMDNIFDSWFLDRQYQKKKGGFDRHVNKHDAKLFEEVNETNCNQVQ